LELTSEDIIGFGSRSERLFVESVEPTEGNLETAAAYLQRLQADMGGTGTQREKTERQRGQRGQTTRTDCHHVTLS
jgi:hypothetical protein